MIQGMERVSRRAVTVAVLSSAIASLVLATAFGLPACSSSTSKATGDAGVDAPLVMSDTSPPIDAQDAAPRHDAKVSDSASYDGGPYDCPDDGGLPNELACTGLYSDWPSKTVASTAIPYTPGFILWADTATKLRWISLPPGTKIDTTDMDDWVFPQGTKIWKQFSLNGTPIETRLEWKTDASDWTFAVYLWAADGSTATLSTNGEMNVNGTTYEVPPVSACPTCHQGRVDYVMGIDIVGTGVPGAQGLTLAMLASQNLLTVAPPATTITIPEDSTGMAAQTLGWMHMNCGVSCHNHNPNAQAVGGGPYLKLLAGEMYPTDGGRGVVASLDSYTSTVNVMAHLTPNGQNYQLIIPGNAAQSLMPLMDLARAPDAGGFKPMPPIVSHIPDTTDVGLEQSWINAL
jgi:hypothetical protein